MACTPSRHRARLASTTDLPEHVETVDRGSALVAVKISSHTCRVALGDTRALLHTYAGQCRVQVDGTDRRTDPPKKNLDNGHKIISYCRHVNIRIGLSFPTKPCMQYGQGPIHRLIIELSFM